MLFQSCDSGPEIILNEILSLTSSSGLSLAQDDRTDSITEQFKTITHSLGHLQSSSASFAHIEQPSISTSVAVTASQPCNAPCCQDSLEVFQVTDKNIFKKTRKVQGHGRQFCPK